FQKDGKTERLEEGLARARAAIREAAAPPNYSRDGSIYRNPHAFHQSYIEMEKRFKVWVYKEGEPPLFHWGAMKDIYSIEGHLIDELDGPHNMFAARHPDEAHVFFLPIGFTNIIHYLYSPRVTYDRRPMQKVVEDYIRVVSNKYPYWNRSSGADHFFVACHDWGPEVSTGKPELFKNFIRVLCNANVSEGFDPARDVSLPEIKVPDDVGLGPPDLTINQSEHNRSTDILAFFAGGPHGHVRETLFRHWEGVRDKEVRVYEYLPKDMDYFKLMSRAKYCLCPSGYEVASPRLIESMHAGCVPVIISDGYALPFEDVIDWTRFSVHIPVRRIPEIKKILEGIPRDEYLAKRRQVLKVKRHFVLQRPAQPYDLLNMVLHSVWLRRLNVRL
ncbi:probable glycosyltransferase at5g20260, partial [Phtheirospermum japonicum]